MPRRSCFGSISPAARSALPAEFAAQSNSPPESPTTEVAREWQVAFAYFNERLFGGTLPDCLITFTSMPGAQGYFCPESFRNKKGRVAHEIALNPAYFVIGDEETYRTLVHEMVHLWRHVFGRRNRKGGYGAPGYHDIVWAEKMEAIGLMPSDTGKPGGRRTGFSMGDYTIEGGPFDLACRELLISGHEVNWRDGRELVWFADPFAATQDGEAKPTAAARARSKSTRTCFVCLGCDLRAWSRRTAKLTCTDCNLPLAAESRPKEPSNDDA